MHPVAVGLDVLYPSFVALQFDHTMSEGKKRELATPDSTSTTSSDGAAAPGADDGVTWKVLPRIVLKFSHSASF